jgi:heme-degrading monooxygenase HmoA
MFVVIWEFEPKAGRKKEFAAAYGPEGVWAQLFKQGEGYLGTELLRAPKKRQRYLTIDRWASEEARDAFLSEHQREYDEIDRNCRELTEGEKELGSFTAESSNG